MSRQILVLAILLVFAGLGLLAIVREVEMNEGRAFIFFVSAMTALPFWVLFFWGMWRSWRLSCVTGVVPKHLSVAIDWSVSIALPFSLAALLTWVL
jgi:hypothetical protein